MASSLLHMGHFHWKKKHDLEEYPATLKTNWKDADGKMILSEWLLICYALLTRTVPPREDGRFRKDSHILGIEMGERQRKGFLLARTGFASVLNILSQ
jgi:hypothetical protein